MRRRVMSAFFGGKADMAVALPLLTQSGHLLTMAQWPLAGGRTAIRTRTYFARRRKIPPTLTLSTIATSRRPSSIAWATH
jgi:hypothetical protein